VMAGCLGSPDCGAIPWCDPRIQWPARLGEERVLLRRARGSFHDESLRTPHLGHFGTYLSTT
jgi:hypothetical protein